MQKTIMLAAVKQYQCSGCMNGNNPNTCPKFDPTAEGCAAHYAGTVMFGAGAIALGMPKGFNRLGDKLRRVDVYASYDEMVRAQPNLTTIFSLPVWKHLDEHGNTLVRWFSPRINAGWVSVTLGDCRDKFPGALEITSQHLAEMD